MNDNAMQPPPGATQLLARLAVCCCERWVNTDVSLVQGARYYFRATGTWHDASIRCDANGYDRPYLNWVKATMRCNVDGARWFTLIGAIDHAEASFFPIGDGSRWAAGWRAPASGRLEVFANDAALMYWNNRGAIMLEIWQ
ncbi:hypothetical protein [Pseudomonas sp. TWI929]|uniref:hypothetical protein n=1 Tax=Pseudomonas sp. TWI929 TaxID=3136795 RepID=UPI00320A7065